MVGRADGGKRWLWRGAILLALVVTILGAQSAITTQRAAAQVTSPSWDDTIGQFVYSESNFFFSGKYKPQGYAFMGFTQLALPFLEADFSSGPDTQDVLSAIAQLSQQLDQVQQQLNGVQAQVQSLQLVLFGGATAAGAGAGT